MERLKLMTIIGTRPEIIRLSETIKKCDKYFDHKLVHTGQNYDYALNQIFFDQLGLREPDFYLGCAGKNLGETMGNIIAASYDVMLAQKPDAVLILGDTNSALSAISAKRLKIPIFHMEAGNRCWDFNVSEMINRKIVDHISDINLPYTEHARRYLISEGIDGKTIFAVGSPMREIIKANEGHIACSRILGELGLCKKRYMLLSAHREENIDIEQNFMSLMEAVNDLAETYNMPMIYSAHPRSRNFIEKRGFVFHPLVRQMEPFGYFDYNMLQQEAYCVLSDSGTLSEESAILGFPAVLIRTSTERPEVLDSGSIVMGGITRQSVRQAVELTVLMNEHKEQGRAVQDYKDEDVSSKVVRIIQSYTDVVNRSVWRKY